MTPKRSDIGLKPKDLVGIPWRVAFALQADGWYLRSDIIWHKPNPMPESVRDRPTKSHEYIFLLSKRPRYFFDADAVREGISQTSVVNCSSRENGPAINGNRKPLHGPTYSRHRSSIPGGQSLQACPNGSRNLRSVWTITPNPFKGAHFATFPPQLVERCVKAGSRPGDLVLDPFSGAGTVGLVCKQLGRQFIGAELNRKYVAMARQRIAAGAQAHA